MARQCNSPCCLAVWFSGHLLSLVSNLTLAKKLVNDKIIIIIIIIIIIDKEVNSIWFQLPSAALNCVTKPLRKLMF